MVRIFLRKAVLLHALRYLLFNALMIKHYILATFLC